MPYQPDPQQVRAIAARIIHSEIDTIGDLGAMDVGEMCEEEIDALQAASPTDAAGDRATNVLIDAVRADIKAATITATWAATPQHAGHDEGDTQ